MKKTLSKNRRRCYPLIILLFFATLIAALIATLYFRWFFFVQVENMDVVVKEHHKKTVFLIWGDKEMQEKTGKSLNQGLGDKMKSLLCLYQYCRLYNCNLIVDASTNVLSKYFANMNPTRKPKNPDDALPENLHVLEVFAGGTEGFISSMNTLWENNDEVCLYTFFNDMAKIKEFEDEDIEFVKHIFEPSDLIKREIEIKKQKLPENYGIRHYRFDDQVFNVDVTENDPLFMKWFDELKESYKATDVLLSNSPNFKDYARRHIGISTMECDDGKECQVQHTGINSTVNTDDNNDKIKNSILEFALIRDAKYIISKTAYSWCSGFIHWPALVYGIPLTC